MGGQRREARRKRRGFALVRSLLAGLLGAFLSTGGAEAGTGEVLRTAPIAIFAPQGLACDPETRELHVIDLLAGFLLRYDQDLEFIEAIEIEHEQPPGGVLGLDLATGLAYISDDETFIYVKGVQLRGIETEKTGLPTGKTFEFRFDFGTIPGGDPFLEGIDYATNGPESIGSLYVVEAAGGEIHEFDLGEHLIRRIPHPDGPKGIPPPGWSPGFGVSVREEGGEVRAIYVTGSKGSHHMVKVLDAEGEYTGIRIPLTDLPGTPAGIEFAVHPDPAGDGPREVLYVVLQDEGIIAMVDATPPPIRELFDLACEVGPDGVVSMRWRNVGEYDAIRVGRDGVVFEIPGDREGFVDPDAPAGVRTYTVQGFLGPWRTDLLTCQVVVGPGRVIRSEPYEEGRPYDITVGPEGHLYITGSNNEIREYNPRFEMVTSYPGPVIENEDTVTGIAYAEDRSSFFLFNLGQYAIVEAGPDLTPLRNPVPVDLPFTDNDKHSDDASIVAMDYDPEGDGGKGSLWLSDGNLAVLWEVATSGAILRALPHPDGERMPFPEEAFYLRPYLWGIARPGGSSRFIDIAGGRVIDSRTAKIERIDTEDGVTCFEIPLLEALRDSRANSLAFAYGEDGTLYAVGTGRYAKIMEIDATAPDPLPPTEIAVRAVADPDGVRIRFRDCGPYDRVEILRDGVPIASLDPGVREYVDTGADPGMHTYGLRGFRDGREARSESETVRVGPGAVLDWTWAFPSRSSRILERDSLGRLWIGSGSVSAQETLHVFDAQMADPQEFPGLFDRDSGINLVDIAIREVDGIRTVYSLGVMENYSFPPAEPPAIILGDQTEEGSPIGLPVSVTPPEFPEGGYAYPAGLEWDPATDSLWYADRANGLLVRMDYEGNPLEILSVPEVPGRSYLIDGGFDIEADRGLIYLNIRYRDGEQEREILELTREGILTGNRVPTEGGRFRNVAGFDMNGPLMWAVGWIGPIDAILEIRAFAQVPPPGSLECAEVPGTGVVLTWRNGGGADRIEIRRNGEVIAELSGDSESYTDTEFFVRRNTYVVVPYRGGQAGPASASTIVIQRAKMFVRGDPDRSGKLNLVDVFLILHFVFSQGNPPRCLDAADLNDDGKIGLIDVLFLLHYIFTAPDPAPKPPFPDAGMDPTPDALPCDDL